MSFLNSGNLIENVSFKGDLIPWHWWDRGYEPGNEVFCETHIFNEISVVQTGNNDMTNESLRFL